jgi:hypothetical protein
VGVGALSARHLSAIGGLFALLIAAAALTVPADRLRATGRAADRLFRLEAERRPAENAVIAGVPAPLADVFAARASRLGPLLASWQTVGGCGAGASASGVGGVRWVGRSVRGGYVNVETQGNYVKVGYGYNYVATTLLTRDVTPEWTAGLSLAYLYKFMYDPYKLGYDLANKGLGDVGVLLVRRFGEANEWRATLSGGLPTASNNVAWRSASNRLLQDRQLGFGRPTAALAVERSFDELWGASIVGTNATWRGGENEFQS